MHGGRGDNDPEVVFGHLVTQRRVNPGPVGARRPLTPLREELPRRRAIGRSNSSTS